MTLKKNESDHDLFYLTLIKPVRDAVEYDAMSSCIGNTIHVGSQCTGFVVDVVAVHKGQGVSPGRPHDVLEKGMTLDVTVPQTQLEFSPEHKNLSQ